jgi:hypothetical protein
MRWAGNAVWGREEVHAGFWWENLLERDHSQDPVIDGRIILIWKSTNGGSMDWIDRDRWTGLVYAVMNL